MDVGADVGTDRSRDFLALLVLDVGDYNGSCAVIGEAACCGLADAACASGDDGHLALELVL